MAATGRKKKQRSREYTHDKEHISKSQWRLNDAHNYY